MGLTVDEIEAEVRKLPEGDRAELIERLLLSLGEAVDLDDRVAQVWAEEAERRDLEMSSGRDAGIPAGEVFKKLRSTPR